MSKRKLCLKTFALIGAIGAALWINTARVQAQEQATLMLAGGCFWCIEADFEKLDGVGDVISGFTGGTVANPSYRDVVRGGTGHYEAVVIPFDPSVISRETLLNAFFRSVDPTDAGGQFCDRGESYRTAIFVSNPQERALAEAAKADAEAELGRAIVTPILDAGAFYMAEAKHQNYYKGEGTVLTRRGPMSQMKAYQFYRDSCGRDTRVRELWGDAAAFLSS